MRPFAQSLLLSAAMATAAFATAPTPQPADPPAAQAPAADPAIDDLLARLQKVGQELQDMTASVRLTDVDLIGDIESTRIGTIWLAPKQEKLRIDLPLRQEGNRLYKDRRIEWMLMDGVLVERDYKRPMEIRRQVLRPGEKLNLLKLGEGPFPLPIGQNPADVKRLFEVKLLEPGEGAPANTVHVRLIPRPENELSRRFKHLDVWVDKTTDFPARIDTVDPDENNQRTVLLSDVKTNSDLPKSAFEMEKIDTSKWERRDETLDR